MAGLGRAPIAAAADRGNANRGSFPDNDEATVDADLGLPTRGERMAVIVKEDGSRDDGKGAEHHQPTGFSMNFFSCSATSNNGFKLRRVSWSICAR